MPPRLSKLSSGFDLYDTGRTSEEREAIAELVVAIRGGGPSGKPSATDLTAKIMREFMSAASERKPDHTAEAQQRAIAQRRESVKQSADHLRTTTTGALAKLETLLRAGTGDDPTDPTEALLKVMQERTAFERLQREFGDDLSPHIDNIVARAAKQGDRATLSSLRAELPSVMRHAFGSDERSAEASTKTYVAMIEQAERPLLNPVVRWHREALDELGAWRSAIETNLNSVDYALDPQGSPSPLLNLDATVMADSPGFEGMVGATSGAAPAAAVGSSGE